MDRSRRVGRPPGPQLRKLYDRKHEMRRLIALGMTNQQIAAILGCSTQTVSNERNNELARWEIDRLHAERDAATADIQETIRAATPVAMKLMERALSGEVDGEHVSMKDRLAVAKHLAGIGGFSPVQRVQAQVQREMAIDGRTLDFLREVAEERRRCRTAVGCEVAGRAPGGGEVTAAVSSTAGRPLVMEAMVQSTGGGKDGES